ncbi:MAG: hypothetical protein PHC88_10535 [Terrimicrobiaceae bacterium]|nr:hypothetical protein [Terrimicrobiaceae bacterium]
MTDNPEIQAKILEWQRRYNIADGDPAMALIELLNIYGYRGNEAQVVMVPAPPGEPAAPAVARLDEAVLEQIRSQLFPAIERLGFQTQELKQKVESMAIDTLAQQVVTYHEGIELCTKKLDTVKKDADALVVQLGRVANSIKPVSRMAIVVLLIFAFALGVVAAVMFRIQ